MIILEFTYIKIWLNFNRIKTTNLKKIKNYLDIRSQIWRLAVKLTKFKNATNLQ